MTPYEKLFIVIVALLTWGGVFFYLLRIERLAKSLEKQVAVLEDEASSPTSSSPSPSTPPLSAP